MRRRVRQIADAFVEHNLLSYAAAIAFQALVALVPMTMLVLGLLGATGNRQLWEDDIAPAIEGRVTRPVFSGIDDTASRILDHGSAGLIVVASLLTVWYLTAAMRAVIEALDRIHDVKERRPWLERILTAVLLGVTGGVCLYSAALLLIELGGVPGWACAVVLVAVTVTLLLRFGPAEKPDAAWATMGAGVIVVAWLVASVLFGLWVRYVADFRSPVGTLTTLLILTSYLFVSATVFLAGAQLDELLRKTR